MIKTTITMAVDTRKLDAIIKTSPTLAKRIIDKAATNVQANAIKNTHSYGGSGRDTGAMTNGWVTRLTTGGGGDIPEPVGDFQATVGNEVDLYPMLWEIGHRGFAPEPSLGDAVEAERRPFARAWQDWLK